ncbi:Serine/threonine-protein kinase Nek1 [Mactra antiquata]
MDKYARVRRIGEGAFGKAELVKKKADGLQYVIKEINISRMGAKEREESRKEVSVLAQLKHPNIVAYRESFEEHGSLYIVMDFCAGGDLYARINSQRGVMFTEDQILDWFAQMCLAIKHIHDRKILHRDIKSQNIFLTSKGMVQLGDFGIAKVLNSTVELARTCIGTPYYLSPEICENKPYNNKSDIWSLGCVLYELATLKHAFEAGNMKNLVLKIIRGSYPPLSPKYSYELRNLVAQLFKRAPRDRPSINSVLKKPLISQRIPKFLTSEQLQEEFSHTVMHGHKLGRALPPPPNQAARPPSASRNRADPSGPAVAAAAKRYDPSKIYGTPVVRKSKENRVPADPRKRQGSAGSRPGSAAGSRPGSAASSRPGSAAGSRPSSSQDLQKRRQELQEKEKKRREEKKKRDEEDRKKEYERRHRELMDKQKVARINKAREEGWNNLVSSLDSDSGKDVAPMRREDRADQARPPAPRPQPGPGGDYNVNAGKGKYDHYNDYLDKLQRDRDLRQRQEGVPPRAPAAAYMGAPPPPRPLPGAPKPTPVWRRAPDITPSYAAQNQRGQNQAEERAKLVEDFISRRKEAAINKQRGHAQLFGPSNNDANRRPPSAGFRGISESEQKAPSAAAVRNKEEQDYLEKLRQIRQQNYNERKNLHAKMEHDKNPQLAADERKKKAEALKKQAEDWAKQRAGVLEKKKQELYEQQKLLREARQNVNRPGVPLKPPVAMTGAMNAIGASPKVVPAANQAPAAAAGMTNILGAIGVQAKVVTEEDEERSKTPIQKQKEEILRKLNQKGPPKENEEPPESARSKWGAGGDIKMAVAIEEPESARSQWGGAPSLDLGQLTLEQTASHMDATSARDKVILNPESARRQWGGPRDTVISALQGVPLAEQTMASDKSEESLTSPDSTNETPAVKGSTITISRSPVRKGTITIRTADENKAAAQGILNQNQPQPSSTDDADDSRLSPVPETSRETSSSPVKGRISPSGPKQTPEVESSPSVNQNEDNKSVSSESSQSQNVLPAKPPLPARKPPVAEKPVVLPKPVLLAQPDKPKDFETGIPKSVVTQEGGSLFNKVELDDENDDDDKGTKKSIKDDKTGADEKITVSEIKDDSVKPKSGLVLGITCGSFDIGHQELLRTCSEPDLASLFRTMKTETPPVRVRSLDDMTTVTEEDEDDMAAAYSSIDNADDNDVDNDNKHEDNPDDENNEGDDDDNDDDEVDEDLEDLISVRATMQSLLVDDSDEDVKKSPVKFSLSSDIESKGDTNDGDIDDTEDDCDGDNSNKHDVIYEHDDDDDDDNKKDKDPADGKNGAVNTVQVDIADLNDDDDDDGDNNDDDGDDFDDDSDVRRSDSVDNENPQTPDESREDMMADLLNTDDSDSEFNDGEDVGEFDLFGRLEESRAQLEEDLGAEKLIQVYKTVQALQEDEDENMEEGARIAQDLLGEDKVHLYPKIFQLVMADAAFTDDNLS